jgi:hypothetical protein
LPEALRIVVRGGRRTWLKPPKERPFRANLDSAHSAGMMVLVTLTAMTMPKPKISPPTCHLLQNTPTGGLIRCG